MSGIVSHRVEDTPIAVVDLETTGLHPSGDAIIEIGVVRVDPGQDPVIVLDTLVDPQRPVAATEIHGITDGDVEGAPTFAEVAPALLSALDGAVLAAYNVYFDVRFLRAQLGVLGQNGFPPHLCLMYMRPLLGVGKRCSLADACVEEGLELEDAHVAATDALLGAGLWTHYVPRMRDLGVETFGDLAARKSYKFTRSFADAPITYGEVHDIRLKSRRERAARPVNATGDRTTVLNEYWEALKAALADLEFTSSEVNYLNRKKADLELSGDELRWLHARAFAGVLADVSQDKRIDDEEVSAIHHVAGGLRSLGWAPGDPVQGRVEHDDAGRPGLLRRLFGAS